MNQKNLVAILGVVVVILLGTTIYFATLSNVGQPVSLPVAQQPVTRTQPAKTAPVTQQPATKQLPQAYQNEEYGFQLTLTDVWKDYQTRVTKNNDNSVDIDFCASIKNSKMATDIPGYVCLFKIIVSDVKKWDMDAAPCKKDRNSGMCDWIDNEIGRNDKNVFSYGAAQDYTNEEKIAFDDIKEIIKSFKLTK
ncbi:MAG: hypothetical protein ABH818_00085 [Patescibacteria group bacterium]